MDSRSENRRCHIVGTGRLARTIARTVGARLASVRGRSGSDAAEVARLGDLSTLAGRLEEPLDAAEGDLLCLLVSDDAIADVAESISSVNELPPGVVVLHCSGALGPEVLSPFRQIDRIACHPNGIFDGTGMIPKGTIWGVTGSSRAQACVADLIGQNRFSAIRVGEVERTAYHLAATLVANYPIVLAEIASRLYSAVGLDEMSTSRILGGYLEAVSRRVGDSESPLSTLTGPVARGDDAVLRGHRLEMEQRFGPEMAQLFDRLVAAARNLGERH